MDYKCIIKNIIFIIFLLLAFWVVCKLSIFYIPFLIAYIISLIVEPLIKWVRKKTDWNRKICSIIILFSLLIFIISLAIWGIVSFISEATNLLNGLNLYIEKGSKLVQDSFGKLDLSKFQFSEEVQKIAQTSADNFINMVSNFIKNSLNKLIDYITSIPTLFIYIIITILATYFITSDKFYILDRMEHHLSKKMVGKMIRHTREITKSLGGYLKAQIILITISFVIVLVGLNLFYFLGMNVEYPILMAILIGFIDALPILGMGTIMIPWILILLINHDISLALSILGLYIIIIVTRQVLEPKIVSHNIGIHPIFTLIAMYTGFKIIGIIGLLIGPIILIILKNIFAETIDKGIINAIMDN